MSDQEKRMQEIRERANAATAGEWEQANKSVRVANTQVDCGSYKAAPTGDEGGICNCLGISIYRGAKSHPINVQATKNAEFIAHARQDIPYLLDLIESIQQEQQEPEPLGVFELPDFVGKPVFYADAKSDTHEWKIVESAYIDYSEYECSLFMLSGNYEETEVTGMDIISGAVKLYATEPKGEATT